jgi:hypothetical protein
MTRDQKLTHARGMKSQFERSLYDFRIHEDIAGAAHARKRIEQWASEIARLEEEIDAPPGLDPALVAQAFQGAGGWPN